MAVKNKDTVMLTWSAVLTWWLLSSWGLSGVEEAEPAVLWSQLHSLWEEDKQPAALLTPGSSG